MPEFVPRDGEWLPPSHTGRERGARTAAGLGKRAMGEQTEPPRRDWVEAGLV